MQLVAMARSGYQGVESGDDQAAQAFWHWICALSTDAASLREWQTSSTQTRQRWLEDHGFLLDELRKGLAELSRTRQIQPPQARGARAWLEQGHLPEQQCRDILFNLAETNIKELETAAGGVFGFDGHPVQRLRTTRDRWANELTEKEEQLYEFERNKLADFATKTRDELQQAATAELQKVGSRLLAKEATVQQEAQALEQEAQTWDRVLRHAERVKFFYTHRQEFNQKEEERYSRYKAATVGLPDVERRFITSKSSFDPYKSYSI